MPFMAMLVLGSSHCVRVFPATLSSLVILARSRQRSATAVVPFVAAKFGGEVE